MDIIGLKAVIRCGPFGYPDLALTRHAGAVVTVNRVCAVIYIAKRTYLSGGLTMLMGDALLLEQINAGLYFNAVVRLMIIMAAVGYYEPGA